MNIDTSTLSSSTETAAYITSGQNRKIYGGNTFSSQLETLKANSDETSEEVSKQGDISNPAEDKVSESSDKENKVQDAKVEQKSENKIAENDSGEIDNTSEQQSNQNSSGQQNANQQFAELSEEILSVIKATGKATALDGLNNFQLVSGISSDVYTTAPKIDYSSISMSDGDAEFFANLVSKTDMSMQSIAGEFNKALQSGKIEQVQKTAQVSATILEALSESMKTNKAFRIDFDKDVSVVMRVDRDGSINANFIPGDKAVEAYLKNNISYLKQRFDEQNLSYGELTYSKHKHQNKDEERQNNKENSHE